MLTIRVSPKWGSYVPRSLYFLEFTILPASMQSCKKSSVTIGTPRSTADLIFLVRCCGTVTKKSTWKSVTSHWNFQCSWIFTHLLIDSGRPCSPVAFNQFDKFSSDFGKGSRNTECVSFKALVGVFSFSHVGWSLAIIRSCFPSMQEIICCVFAMTNLHQWIEISGKVKNEIQRKSAFDCRLVSWKFRRTR